MRILKKTAFILLILAVLISARAYASISYSKPAYTGEIQLWDLQNNTAIYFDEFRIPHMYANNKVYTYTSLGYFWQMELLKGITPARFAEIFGKEVLQTDMFFIKLGIKENFSSLENKLDNQMIDWNWGKVLTLEHPHALITVSYLKKDFTVGIFSINATSKITDNRLFNYNEIRYYLVTGEPFTRRIIDFSDIENSSILPIGQRRIMHTKHYKD